MSVWSIIQTHSHIIILKSWVQNPFLDFVLFYKIYWKDQFSSQGLNYIGLQD
jgi:hypothetical protein